MPTLTIPKTPIIKLPSTDLPSPSIPFINGDQRTLTPGFCTLKAIQLTIMSTELSSTRIMVKWFKTVSIASKSAWLSFTGTSGALFLLYSLTHGIPSSSNISSAIGK